ncbi:MAG: ornithine cyclodeaminase family protein [Kurthia sp.]|nr:ornithine cyclodeaminase family protein [Candidatus Kurthia equi]
MIILNEQEIQDFYTMKEAIIAVKGILQSKQAKQLETPARTVIDFPSENASILYMPSADLEQQFAANKIVSIFPNNPTNNLPTTQGVLALNDAQNGQLLALLNASYLTRLRTGAISAIATDYLARKEANSLTVIGTGAMAFEQVIGVLEVREIQSIQLYNRTKVKAELFKEKLQHMYPAINIEIYEDVNEAVRGAHIINCATRSTVAVFDGKYVAEGTHINGVGSYLPSMREIDEKLIIPENKIVVDDFHGVIEEAGEFMYANDIGQWSFEQIHGTLEQLESKVAIGRENEKEITIFKSVGAAYYDLAVAIGVYKQAVKTAIGTKVEI